MSKPEYQLNPGKINANTEETSAISYFSYQIENANISGLDKVKMYQQIDILKDRYKFLLILNMLIVTLILLLE